ncbi:MAG: class I SAM-dependent methyltransferase, partial [Cutibacterium avidum]|nr:class I SAM-dependent methyltransferase [Cutibacterium avidum]
MLAILPHRRGRPQTVWKTGRVLTTRATLDKHHADVASMFDGVAKRYDLMNQIMTMGAVDIWRDLVVDAVEPEPGQVILD